MPDRDVWIFGAGASADAGAPTVSEFKNVARQVLASSTGNDAQALSSVLNFWESRLSFLDIEQLFGFIDSPDMAVATAEGDLSELRKQTLYLIAKSIASRLKGRPAPAYERFVEYWLESFVPVVTLNWDILLEEALLAHQRRVTYAIPGTPDWDPRGSQQGSQLVFKLHGSLNWLKCNECKQFTFLDEKSPVAEFLLTGRGLRCSHCDGTSQLSVQMVPPVLSKLSGDEAIRGVWKEAYKVLCKARRVFIVGYSFPITDLQTRLFLLKARARATTFNR